MYTFFYHTLYILILYRICTMCDRKSIEDEYHYIIDTYITPSTRFNWETVITRNGIRKSRGNPQGLSPFWVYGIIQFGPKADLAPVEVTYGH